MGINLFIKTCFKVSISSVLLLIAFSMQSAFAKGLMLDFDAFQDIDIQNQFLFSNSHDGFLVFKEVSMPVSDLQGIELRFELSAPITKPALFELFWTTDDTGFNETQKAMFMLPSQESTQYSIYLKLSDLYNFAGFGMNEINERLLTSIRLDYPAVEGFGLRMESANFIKSSETHSAKIKIEPVERMLLHSKAKWAALVKKLKITFIYGAKRFLNDGWFSAFWLLLVTCLAVMTIFSGIFLIKNYKK